MDNPAVRRDYARWVRRIMSACIRHTNPKMVRSGPALHRLPHYVSVNTGAFLTGVVKRLEDTIHATFVQLPINFRKPQIKTYQKRALHTIDHEIDKPIAGCKTLQIAGGTKPLVITVDNSAPRIYKIQTVVRLVGPGQSVRTAKYNPQP